MSPGRLCVALIALAMGLMCGNAQAGEPWAVVVGIDRYADPQLQPLQFAVSDARTMVGELVGLGFDARRIVLLEDRQATRERILQVLGDELPKQMGPDDSLLVYWSGHGITETLPNGDQNGYLMAYDADLRRPFATAVPMKIMRDLSERNPARHMLFLLDACYSGLAVPGLRAHLEWSAGGGFAQLEKYDRLPSRHILTAGQAGERVMESEGHGLFTRLLIRGLNGEADTDGDGVLAATELAAWMRARVTEASGMAQTPQYSRWYGEGEYTFVVGPVSQGAVAATEGAYRGPSELQPALTAAATNSAGTQAPWLQRARGPGLALAGVGLVAAGSALYLSGSNTCAELGPEACNNTMKPLVGATFGLWGGGALTLAAGLGFTFGGPSGGVSLRALPAPVACQGGCGRVEPDP